MDPRIYEQHAALRGARTRVAIIGAGAGAAEAVDPAGFDVDTRDLGSVVCGEDCELDGAAPGIRREDCADVFVAWMPFFFVVEVEGPNPMCEKKRDLKCVD